METLQEKLVPLYSLGEGSTFRIPQVKSVQWVVTKHDREKIEFEGDVFGKQLYSFVPKKVARNVRVMPMEIVKPTNFSKIDEALKFMSSTSAYVEVGQMEPGDVGILYRSTTQDLNRIRILKQKPAATWIALYNNYGVLLGEELITNTRLALRIFPKPDEDQGENDEHD